MKIPYTPGRWLPARWFASRRMKRDWDLRARENAHYYIECGHGHDPGAFWASGESDVETLVLRGVALDPAATVLEIGCGVGRLLAPMARRARLAIGVDISAEMIARAREAIGGRPGVELHRTDGRLESVADGTVDFVYSFIVFQHIPVKEAVLRYFREAGRVLRPGGLFRFQVDTSLERRRRHDSWNGVRFDAGELVPELGRAGLAVLDVAAPGTQYTWVSALREPRSAAAGSRARFAERAWRVEALEALASRLGLDAASSARRVASGEIGVRALAQGFLDASAALAPADFVAKAYEALLGRAADPGGLAFYAGEIESGIDRRNVVDSLLGSAEFDERYRRPSGAPSG